MVGRDWVGYILPRPASNLDVFTSNRRYDCYSIECVMHRPGKALDPSFNLGSNPVLGVGAGAKLGGSAESKRGGGGGAKDEYETKGSGGGAGAKGYGRSGGRRDYASNVEGNLYDD